MERSRGGLLSNEGRFLRKKHVLLVLGGQSLHNLVIADTRILTHVLIFTIFKYSRVNVHRRYTLERN